MSKKERNFGWLVVYHFTEKKMKVSKLVTQKKEKQPFLPRIE